MACRPCVCADFKKIWRYNKKKVNNYLYRMHASPLCVDLNYLASEKTINFLLSRIVGGLGKEASRAPETSRGAPRNHLSHRRA